MENNLVNRNEDASTTKAEEDVLIFYLCPNLILVLLCIPTLRITRREKGNSHFTRKEIIPFIKRIIWSIKCIPEFYWFITLFLRHWYFPCFISMNFLRDIIVILIIIEKQKSFFAFLVFLSNSCQYIQDSEWDFFLIHVTPTCMAMQFCHITVWKPFSLIYIIESYCKTDEYNYSQSDDCLIVFDYY